MAKKRLTKAPNQLVIVCVCIFKHLNKVRLLRYDLFTILRVVLLPRAATEIAGADKGRAGWLAGRVCPSVFAQSDGAPSSCVHSKTQLPPFDTSIYTTEVTQSSKMDIWAYM